MSDQVLTAIIAEYFKTQPILRAWLFGSFARGEATPDNIIDMRNVLVHGYYIASPLFIWETYTNDLGPLLEQVKGYIKELQA